MPKLRLFGNAGLSFLTKLSSGYWNIFDSTNGYTAIYRVALEMLPLAKIDRCFFFESDSAVPAEYRGRRGDRCAYPCELRRRAQQSTRRQRRGPVSVQELAFSQATVLPLLSTRLEYRLARDAGERYC